MTNHEVKVLSVAIRVLLTAIIAGVAIGNVLSPKSTIGHHVQAQTRAQVAAAIAKRDQNSKEFGSASSLTSVRLRSRVNVRALAGETLVPGCRFAQARSMYPGQHQVLLFCPELSKSSSGFIERSEKLTSGSLECTSGQSDTFVGTIWECVETSHESNIVAYGLSEEKAVQRYAALVEIANANLES